ncbi:hypothetical protein CLF_108892 [Clonorchis sinensis]|uniref:Uncharacterized protein n=1 Tax=Clonorchis sinensis TaxID=79923 RepID=G7YIR0_CLOSI|nr:hypothetical protein CLF_108892 [Clonorchis sinensis]
MSIPPNNGIIRRIQLSSDPLSLIRSLKEGGICLRSLSSHAEFRTLLCNLVRQSFGLGLKLLIDCDLDLSVHDPHTGDSPLLLVCMEGLCGPTKKLIEHLPWPSLLHANTSGVTPLKSLMTRGHGSCGCIEELLAHLPLSVLLLPSNMYHSLTFATQRGEFSTVWTSEQVRNGFLTMSPNIDSVEGNQYNVLLLSLSSLLDRIQSSDPKRMISVVQLWIQANLLLIQKTDKPIQYEQNLRTIAKKLLSPILSKPAPSNLLVGRLLDLLSRLIILDQLDSRTVWFQLHDILIEQGLAEGSGYLCQTIRFAANRSGVPLSLHSLIVRQLRKIFQQRFVQSCLSTPGRPGENALIFTHWTVQLPLPQIVISRILLAPLDFSDL